MLAPYIFKRCGENFKAFQHVEFSFGYNMDVGDNFVVHRHVLLDDRGGIVVGNNVSVSDYANIYSHTHSIVDQKDVTDAVTILEDNVRITYHATVLAGVRVACNGMVGALAVATKDVRPYHVYVGIPAKSIRVKPNAPQDAQNVLLCRFGEGTLGAKTGRMIRLPPIAATAAASSSRPSPVTALKAMNWLSSSAQT